MACKGQFGWGVLEGLEKHKNRHMASLEVYVARDLHGNQYDVQLGYDRYLQLIAFRTNGETADGATLGSWILLEGPVDLGHAGKARSAERESEEHSLHAGSHLSLAAPEEDENSTPVQLRHRVSEEGAEDD